MICRHSGLSWPGANQIGSKSGTGSSPAPGRVRQLRDLERHRVDFLWLSFCLSIVCPQGCFLFGQQRSRDTGVD